MAAAPNFVGCRRCCALPPVRTSAPRALPHVSFTAASFFTGRERGRGGISRLGFCRDRKGIGGGTYFQDRTSKPENRAKDEGEEHQQKEQHDDREGGSAVERPQQQQPQQESVQWKWPPWDSHIPQKYTVIGATSLAFVICNMDKVNLSVAIIPMSHQFGWNSSTAGVVQSAFFWGYALSQLPGGWLAKNFGGRKVLEVGVFTWSLATALVPLLAGFMPGLVLSRILVGIGEGVSPSAATELIARTIPVQERSRAVAVVFGGLSVGSVLGFLAAPWIIQNFGWETVFYLFGFLGILWCFGFDLIRQGQSLVGKMELFGLRSGSLRTAGRPNMASVVSRNASIGQLGDSSEAIPWEEFFKNPPVWAMIYAHFCGSWGHYTCLSWLPTFFSEELNLNLTEAAWVSILPPLGAILVTSVTAPFADYLIAKGFGITKVRKVCQTIAFLSPAAFMTLSSLDLHLPPWEIIAFLTSGLALSNFSLSGLYCTHQDISPKYASVLLGITNSVGAVPGILGVTLTGYLLDSTHSWSMSLFYPSIFFYLTGTIVWLIFASSDPQTFSKED